MSNEDETPDKKTQFHLENIDSIAKKLREGCGYEAILTTHSKKTFNFSAVGVKRHGRHLALNIFEGEDSYTNMLKRKGFGLSFLSPGDVDPFYKASIQGWLRDGLQEFEEEELEFFCDIPYVKKGIIYLFCKVVERAQRQMNDAVGKSSFLSLKAEILDWKIKEAGRDVLVFSRGPALFVEALIHFTKLKAFLDKQGSEKTNCIPGEMVFRFRALVHQLKTLETLGWEKEYEEHCATLKKAVKEWGKSFFPDIFKK